MPIHFFYPKNIAVIGASADPKKFGNALTKNILESNFISKKRCEIFLISHGSKEISGYKTFKSLLEIQAEIDLAIILVPAKVVNGVIGDCIKKKVRNIIIVTGGFGEIDEKGKLVEKEIAKKCNKAGIRVIGPNCVGIENVDIELNASFIQLPPKGNISMIAQSGSFACACFYEMEAQNLGISKFANIGNQIDINFIDILDFYKKDENTRTICLYIETMATGRAFYDLLREITPQKPVIIMVGGRTESGMKAASSHTGSIATNYNIMKNAVTQAGAILCEKMSDYMTALKTMSNLPVPVGEKIGVLTNSGGSSVLFSDAADKFNLTIAEFSEEFKNKITPHIIPLVKKVNPLDMIAGAAEEQYYRVTKLMLEEPGIDIVVGCSVIPPFLNIKHEEHYRGIIRAWNETGRKKPVIPLMVFGQHFITLKNYANSENATVFYTPFEAAYAVKLLVDRMKFLQKN